LVNRSQPGWSAGPCSASRPWPVWSQMGTRAGTRAFPPQNSGNPHVHPAPVGGYLHTLRVPANGFQVPTAIFTGQAKCTPTFYFMHSNLEWESVHSNFFGVESCPFQYIWSRHLSTPKIFTSLGMHSQFTPKIWSAPKVHFFWSAPYKVHSKKFGVHFKSTPKNLECTQSPLQKNLSTQHYTPKISPFWSA
jgi:hypothetical protein